MHKRLASVYAAYTHHSSKFVETPDFRTGGERCERCFSHLFYVWSRSVGLNVYVHNAADRPATFRERIIVLTSEFHCDPSGAQRGRGTAESSGQARGILWPGLLSPGFFSDELADLLKEGRHGALPRAIAPAIGLPGEFDDCLGDGIRLENTIDRFFLIAFIGAPEISRGPAESRRGRFRQRSEVCHPRLLLHRCGDLAVFAQSQRNAIE